MAALAIITVSLAAFSGVWFVTSFPLPQFSNLRQRLLTAPSSFDRRSHTSR